MNTVLSILHVVGAVFVIGPMAILPMTALRALRAGRVEQVTALSRSIALLGYLSLVVAVLGFGVLGMADPKYDLSVTTPWVLASIVLYVIAIVVTLALVVPALRRSTVKAATPQYGLIAAGSGVSSLLLVAVVVLMVWKP